MITVAPEESPTKANQQVRKHRCASADRRQRFLSDKTAYYHRICRIIELLKKVPNKIGKKNSRSCFQITPSVIAFARPVPGLSNSPLPVWYLSSNPPPLMFFVSVSCMHPAHRSFTYRNSYVFSLFFSRKSHFQLNSAPQSARSPHRDEILYQVAKSTTPVCGSPNTD